MPPQNKLGEAQPIMDSVYKIGHAVLHPLDALQSMLHPDQPAPQPMPQADPAAVNEANKSFQTPEHLSEAGKAALPHRVVPRAVPK